MGDVVLVQNQRGKYKIKWDLSGKVVEVLLFGQYQIRMDGLRHVTLQNRRFLWKIVVLSRGRVCSQPLVN